MAGNSVLAKMAVQIVANNAQFAAAMKQSQAQMTAFQKTAQRVNTSLATLGVGFGLMEAARGIQYVIGVMADFQKTMSEVRAITGATGKEFTSLENDAKRLGGATKFTASEVAQLQVAYGRLGFNTQEILDATEATLHLAAATGEDLAKSADVAGATVRGFGLNASETLRVVDVMASSFNKTALGLDNFTESMKYVAPIANAAGASVEETTAMLGVLADAGVRGSQAGTSLRKIFTDMTKDGRPLRERLAELAEKGITLGDSFDEVGRTAQTALLILSKNTEKTAELTSALQGASGEAKNMAEVMQDNLTGDITKLTSAIDGLILSFSEGTGPIRDMVQALTELVKFLAQDEVVKFLKFTTALAFIVPRHIGKAIKAIQSLDDAEEEFDKMSEERRAKWLAMQKKTTEAVNTQTQAVDKLLKKEKEAAAFTLSQTAQRAMGGASVTGTTNLSGVGFANVDTTAIETRMKSLGETSATVTEEISQNWVDLSGIVGGAISSLAEGLGGAIVGVEDFGSTVLKSFAGFAKEFGSMLIASGVAALALDKLITNPVGAIAAGVALVAIAGAASASLSNAHSGLTGGASGPGRASSDIGVNISGRIRGYDLAVVGDKESYRRSRVG